MTDEQELPPVPSGFRFVDLGDQMELWSDNGDRVVTAKHVWLVHRLPGPTLPTVVDTKTEAAIAVLQKGMRPVPQEDFERMWVDEDDDE